jgi:serine/threonine-protein kinase
MRQRIIERLVAGEACAVEASSPPRTLPCRPRGGARRRSLEEPSPSRVAERQTLARRFRILGKVGEGSQGIAYLCGDIRRPGARVVIKLSRPEIEARAALAGEVRVLRDLRGAPGVPALKALLFRGGTLRGFVTPYFGGDTLERLIYYGGILRSEVVAIAMGLTEAVLGISERGYLHRDIKPENVLCSPEGRVQILDFGLARRVSDNCANAISGTLAYASPEQIAGWPLDSRSDLFSLGLLLYEIVKGRSFFSQDAPDIARFLADRERRLAEPVGSLEVDGRLAVLIRRLLVKDVDLRACPAEVRARLRELEDRYSR